MDLRFMFQSSMLVGVGAFFGANARYWLGLLAAHFSRETVYGGTFFVNVTGSLLLGVLLAWGQKHGGLPDSVRLMIATGFFGSYTTFSTFANESVMIGQGGQWYTVAGYIILTNATCLIGALLGWWIGQRL